MKYSDQYLILTEFGQSPQNTCRALVEFMKNNPENLSKTPLKFLTRFLKNPLRNPLNLFRTPREPFTITYVLVDKLQ